MFSILKECSINSIFHCENSSTTVVDEYMCTDLSNTTHTQSIVTLFFVSLYEIQYLRTNEYYSFQKYLLASLFFCFIVCQSKNTTTARYLSVVSISRVRDNRESNQKCSCNIRRNVYWIVYIITLIDELFVMSHDIDDDNASCTVLIITLLSHNLDSEHTSEKKTKEPGLFSEICSES